MDKRYRTSAHSRYIIFYHLVFCPKCRRKIFKDFPIDDHVRTAVTTMAGYHDWMIEELETDQDHIHIWAEGYYVSTVSDRATKEESKRYIRNQKRKYDQLKLL